MSAITVTNSQPTVYMNGSEITGKLKPLAKDMSMGKAKSYLENHADGYNTMGIRLDGKDYLFLTQQYLDPGAQIHLDDKRAQLIFTEEEDTTPPDFGDKVWGLFTGGLVGGAFGSAAGFFGSMLFDHPAPLVIGMAVGVVGGMVGGYMGPEAIFVKPDDTVSDLLTDTPVLQKSSSSAP